MNETTFKEKVIKDLKTLGNCWFIKTMERGRVGTPDLLICLRGKFVAIELKREGKHTTKLQQLTLSKIAAAQGISFESSPSIWDGQFELLKGLK
jgi:hypothetical protein